SMVWGDFNGDGVGDLAAEIVNGGVQNSRNAVLVLYGTAGSGFSVANHTLLVVDEGLNPGNSPFVPPSGCRTSMFCATSRGGDIALAASDFNGDARDELLIGAPNCREIDDDFRIVSGAVGCVAIVRGRATGFDRFFGWDVLRPGDNDLDDNARFGSALAVGNFDGAGNKDVAVGAPDTLFDTPQVADNAGSVRVFFNVEPVFSQVDLFAQSTLLTQIASGGNQAAEAGDRFGAALAANDFNGDGLTDLAVGTPGESTGSTTGHGAVNVFHGSTGSGLTAGPTLLPQSLFVPVGVLCCFGGAAFGSSLTAWNFGAGAPADLAIGSPSFTLANATNTKVTVAGAGAVLTMYGQPNAGLIFPVMQLWTQNPGFPVCTTGFCLTTAGTARAGNHFGSAVY
ncbi:MAG TPA: FG-GAP repeat protein, partial [Vicinamibacterales bacterium]|nr:FG-GAP repeat protein [Vicinamibacterales bacterium]